MTDQERRVGPGVRVTLHFSVSLADGTLLDTTKNGNPASFTFGDGSLLEGFEQSIVGLKVGDRRSVFLTPEQGFGPYNEDNVQRFPCSQFADMTLEPGLVVSFADAARAELPGVVKEVSAEWVWVDFNHPLAGRDLNFEVEIINIVDADSASVMLQ
jgi:FKBP-type peptidyl-prolyl cis-trans isomerase SlpA